MENNNNRDYSQKERNPEGNQPKNTNTPYNTNTKEERDADTYQNTGSGESPKGNRDANQSAYDSGTNPDRYTSKDDNLGKNADVENTRSDVASEVEDNDLIPNSDYERKNKEEEFFDGVEDEEDEDENDKDENNGIDPSRNIT